MITHKSGLKRESAPEGSQLTPSALVNSTCAAKLAAGRRLSRFGCTQTVSKPSPADPLGLDMGAEYRALLNRRGARHLAAAKGAAAGSVDCRAKRQPVGYTCGYSPPDVGLTGENHLPRCHRLVYLRRTCRLGGWQSMQGLGLGRQHSASSHQWTTRRGAACSVPARVIRRPDEAAFHSGP